MLFTPTRHSEEETARKSRASPIVLFLSWSLWRGFTQCFLETTCLVSSGFGGQSWDSQLLSCLLLSPCRVPVAGWVNGSHDQMSKSFLPSLSPVGSHAQQPTLLWKTWEPEEVVQQRHPSVGETIGQSKISGKYGEGTLWGTLKFSGRFLKI